MTTIRWVCLVMWLTIGLVAGCGSPQATATEPAQVTQTPQPAPMQGELQTATPAATAAATAAVTQTPTPQPTPVTPVVDVPSKQPPAQIQTPPPAGPPLDDSAGFFMGPDAKWPDFLPDDIPELEGEMHTLMIAPGSHIRMLYENISDEDIARYVERMEKAGFHVTGIVYVVPGFPDKSEEKLARGEYDAFDIKRGVYSMRLAFGAGQASYDINTAAFLPAPERPTPTAAKWQWPEEIADLAPAPEHCSLVDIVPLNPSGYHITCSREDETVVADYIEMLQSLGYAELDKLANDQGELVILTLEKDGASVRLSPLFTGDLIIDVRPAGP